MHLTHMQVARLLAAGLAGIALLAACSDTDDPPNSTPTAATVETTVSSSSPTASPTLAATSTSTATATPTEAPPTATPTTAPTTTATAEPPPLPSLPAGADQFTTGTVELLLPPAGQDELDPVHVSVADVGQAPICAGLVATWSWGTDPAGNDLVVTAIRQGGGDVVGEGPTGSAELGCMLLRFANNGSEQVKVTVHYAIGDIS